MSIGIWNHGDTQLWQKDCNEGRVLTFNTWIQTWICHLSALVSHVELQFMNQNEMVVVNNGDMFINVLTMGYLAFIFE